MKNNKSLPLIIVLAVLVIILTCICIFLLVREDSDRGHYYNGDFGIGDLKESSIKVPKFEIRINGAYTGIINDEFVKEDGIKVYEFDFTADNGDTVVNHYVGVRLKELIEYYQLDNFTSISLKSLDRITIEYLQTEITDDMYVVFYENGQVLSSKTGRPMFIEISNKNFFSLDDVFEMYFNVSDIDRVDTSDQTDDTE